MKKNSFKRNTGNTVQKKLCAAVCILFLTTLVGPLVTANNGQQTVSTAKVSSTAMSSLPYQGMLRVYIVEPESRWNNYDGDPYHFGFLDFAYNNAVSIDYLDTYETTLEWRASEAGFSDVQEDNIMVIAALFDPEIHKAYAYPPFNNPFEAHYVDATAGATPGNTDSNIRNEEFSHTTLIEEATAQYCPYCPAMANALYAIYESGEYPFYFVALVTKDRQGNTIDDVALQYLITDYNLAAYPSAFFDGGNSVTVGGIDNVDFYTNKLAASGRRDVHELDLTLSVEWVGDGELSIDLSITNNEEFFNEPPADPQITGPSSGKKGVEQTFEITATDPDGNDLYYYINWGDGSPEELVGPYKSGKTATVTHTWAKKGTYMIQVKSRDVYDATSDWVTMEISIPKSKSMSMTPLLRLFLNRILLSAFGGCFFS
jgi:hypothetical protein